MNVPKRALILILICFIFLAQIRVHAQTLQQTAPITQAPSSDTTSDSASTLQKTQSADATPTPPTPQQTSQPSSFHYTVKAGQNLTLLVRKSVLLYDQQRTDLSLSEPQVTFVESYVVDALGSKQVDIGDSISIETALLDTYIQKALELNAYQVSTWQPYADQSDFDLKDIQPDSAGFVNAKDEKTSPTIDVKNDLDTNFKNTVSKTNHSSAFWYWTLSGFGALSIAYYLLSAKPTRETK
jgi:hypothetical protein